MTRTPLLTLVGASSLGARGAKPFTSLKPPKPPKRWLAASREELELSIYDERAARFRRALFPAFAMGRGAALTGLADDGFQAACLASHPWVVVAQLPAPEVQPAKTGYARPSARLTPRRLGALERRRRARLWNQGRGRRRMRRP